ncbi:MAG: DinB family protein [Bacteroidia bacterium]
MYRKIDDFLIDWKHESESTLNVFKNITNEVLHNKPHENIRSIAILIWHIIITLNEMLNKAGLAVTGPEEYSKPPATISEIITEYENSSKSVVEEVKKRWNDTSLLEEVNMYGDTWTKGTVLSILIKHQSHHRGQLSTLMRLFNLKVPGIYGPAKEEWAAWNMPTRE